MRIKMTKSEIYEFDLNGYIIYRDILTRCQVNSMNQILDSHLPEDTHDGFSFLDLDPIFLEVMANKQTLNIIRTMIGDWLHLDHAYGLQMDKRTVELGHMTPNLHGGPRKDNGEHHYQWVNGQMYNGLIVVMYALEDIHPGDGGFICVPGSHKGNMDFKPQVNSHLVVNPSFMAGDMLIFTEALIHGTTTWTSSKKRRAILYKYSPGHSTWSKMEDMVQIRELATNKLQQDLLRLPSVEGRTPLDFADF